MNENRRFSKFDFAGYTIHFVGGPWHGRWHTGAFTVGMQLKLWMRDGINLKLLVKEASRVHEYEMHYLRGAIAVARYLGHEAQD